MYKKNVVEIYLKTAKDLINKIELGQIGVIVNRLSDCIQKGNKILICGNGGSAADASHFAAELVCRFRKKRKAIPAIALTVDSAVLTAIGNDFSFNSVFSRQVEAIGNRGDILIALTTSGRSQNIIEAAKTAQKNGIKVISLTSNLAEKPIWSDLNWQSNSIKTSHTQEQMLIVIHAICLGLEETLGKEE